MNLEQAQQHAVNTVDKYEYIIDEMIKELVGNEYCNIANLTDNEYRLLYPYFLNMFSTKLNFHLTSGLFYTKKVIE